MFSKIISTRFHLLLCIFTSIIFFFFYCQKPKKNEAVIQVGKISLDCKKLDTYVKLHRNKTGNDHLSQKEIEKYINEGLIEFLLFLDAAYDSGYTTKPEVKKKCLQMTKKYLTAGDGLLFKRYLEDSLGIFFKENNPKSNEFQDYVRQIDNIAKDFESRFLDSVKIEINWPTFNTFYEKNYRSGYYFRKQILEKFTPSERANILFKYDKTNVSVGEWIDFYLTSPVIQIIENKNMLIDYLRKYIFEELAYLYAKKTGLLEDSRLQKFIKVYSEKVMVEVFKREFISKNIIITENDVFEEYTNNLSQYMTEPTFGLITIEFLRENDVETILHSGVKSNIGFIELKHKFEKNIEPAKEDIRYFAQSILPYSINSQKLHSLAIDSISTPIKHGVKDRFFLLKKVEYKQEMQIPFFEVKDQIKEDLLSKRYSDDKRQIINLLFKNRAVKINHRLLEEYISKFENDNREVFK